MTAVGPQVNYFCKRICKIKGFTIIELIVVIAIIAVLAGIVLVNVTQYINKSKVARAYAEADSIYQALQLFYAQYGDYPHNHSAAMEIMGGVGETEPQDSNGNKLSEFYKLPWTDYNAKYLASDAFYYVAMQDNDGNGDFECIVVSLYRSTWAFYGCKTFGCSWSCEKGTSYPYPFSSEPY